jgi:hypothetical protein
MSRFRVVKRKNVLPLHNPFVYHLLRFHKLAILEAHRDIHPSSVAERIR